MFRLLGAPVPKKNPFVEDDDDDGDDGSDTDFIEGFSFCLVAANFSLF